MRRCHSTRADPDQGFTILEIMVAVVIIGILVAIVIPIYLHLQRNSQNSRFISDLRTFSQAYETYAMTYGKWPPSAASGVVPTGLSGELQDSHWAVINSLGGHWKWDYNRPRANGFIAGLSITGITVSDAQMIEIDKKMDDGDLATGSFIKGTDGVTYTYILQK
jgi:prepilin-type N-terminal cleavage/methylation domain-containing protein